MKRIDLIRELQDARLLVSPPWREARLIPQSGIWSFAAGYPDIVRLKMPSLRTF